MEARDLPAPSSTSRPIGAVSLPAPPSTSRPVDAMDLPAPPSTSRPVAATNAPAPPFTNEPIDHERIPRMVDLDFTPLDRRLLTTRVLSSLMFDLVVVALSIALAVVFHPLWLLLVLGTVVLSTMSIVLQRIEIAHMGYAVRERDFSFRSGVVGRRVATVPFARVQHVSMESGVIERRFGLSTLELRTAGESVSVPGLKESVAKDLKGLVIDRAGELAETEREPDRLDP